MDRKFTSLEVLVIREINGELTEEEKAWLQKESAIDPQIAEMRAYFKEVLQHGEIDEYLAEHPTDQQLKMFTGRLTRGLRPLYIGIAAAAAAAVALLLYVNVVFNKPSNQPISGVILRLPDGNVVNVDKDTAATKGALQLANNNQTLALTGNSAEWASLEIPAGKDHSLRLPDGTLVQLNASSTIRFPVSFNASRREVFVNGEAYFKVSSDPTRPFIVHLPDGDVQVLGTEFNVNAYHTTTVSLIQGSVKVVSAKDSLILTPDKEARLTQAKIETSTFDADETLAWRQGRYVFNNASPKLIAEVISRLFAKNVVLDNQPAADLALTAILYKNQPLEQQLQMLQETGVLQYKTDAQGVIHISFRQ
jgi:transmembrane sensor